MALSACSVSSSINAEAIEKAKQGDAESFEGLYALHKRRVYSLCLRMTGNTAEAEDLTQDIFLKIFKSLDTFDRRANFQTWLISVSRNLCIDHYRSVRKERETIDRDVDAIVARFTQHLEKWVRAVPAQYFWQHRRWKRQPPDTPRELRDPSA